MMQGTQVGTHSPFYSMHAPCGVQFIAQVSLGLCERPLTLCRPDGLLIKYPQFPDLLNALNVQPHNIFLLTV